MLPQKVELILQKVTQLRPMPSNVTRILKELENPEVTVRSVSEYVGLDQALAALVLQMSNSAALGYNNNCVSLHDAIMRIGLKRLKTILLASPAVDSLNKRLMGYRLGSGELWTHSISTAVACEWLARALGYAEPEEAYTSGLLHDLGKLLLDQYVLTDYTKMVDYIVKYRMPLWQVEESLIGIDHARVGGLIAERWQFPLSLVDAIRYHHYPSFARANSALPAIVNLANSITSQLSFSNSELFSHEIHPETFNILNLTVEKFVPMRERLMSVLAVQQ